jgi:hypothetical protein
MFHHLPWKSTMSCLHSWVACVQVLLSVEACVHSTWLANFMHHFGSLISARPKKSTEASGGMSVSAITSPERVGRTRSRVAGVSQSQRKLCVVVDVSCQQPGLNMLCTYNSIADSFCHSFSNVQRSFYVKSAMCINSLLSALSHS